MRSRYEQQTPNTEGKNMIGRVYVCVYVSVCVKEARIGLSGVN